MPSTLSPPEPPPKASSSIEIRIQSDVIAWLMQNGPRITTVALFTTRDTTRRAITVLLCAGLQLALPTVAVLGEACFPILAGLVACHILTVDRLETALGLALGVGLAEATLCPSLNLGLLPMVYVLTTLVLRTITDYPTRRQPRDTLIVGATVCLVSSLAGVCHVALTEGNSFPDKCPLAFSLFGEILLGSLVVTPLLVAAAVVGKHVGAALWEAGTAACALTAAYFLRHVKPPVSI